MILNRQRAVRLVRRPLELFMRHVKSELGLEESGLAVCLVSDAEIARMNETFRKKKGPTDVLSFPMVARRRPVRLGRGSRTVKAGEYFGDLSISPAAPQPSPHKNCPNLSNQTQPP